MNLYKCILTANDCYKKQKYITPKGVMVHSTGSSNPNLKRYVQPLKSDTNYSELIDLIGLNNNHNDWNKSGISKCVHAFIGKLANGNIGTVQTLPWNMRGWHCGADANNTHISFEICEDNLTDENYFNLVYREAVELTAYLCEMYNLDPLEDGVVICHSEGYRRGIASGHADVEHWFPKFGKTMDDFRNDVKEEMEMNIDNLTDEQLVQLYSKMIAALGKLDGSSYSKEDRDWAVENGYFKGNENGEMLWQVPLNREQFAVVEHRIHG